AVGVSGDTSSADRGAGRRSPDIRLTPHRRPASARNPGTTERGATARTGGPDQSRGSRERRSERAGCAPPSLPPPPFLRANEIPAAEGCKAVAGDERDAPRGIGSDSLDPQNLPDFVPN